MKTNISLLILSILLVSLSAFSQDSKNVGLYDERVETYLNKSGLLSKIDSELSFKDQYQNKTRYVLVQHCGAVVVFDLYNSGTVNIIHKNQCLSSEEQSIVWLDEVNKDSKGNISRVKFLD
ncbi:hypothetical protein [Flammeovirga kamogawensis]|uniref:DUF3192 domain-containing protein n=1 Tax=Flammeovirga kamogawensis TaxID=373891 RepID=A0ABX8GRZ1_9BACT|nr:hypothetical protein [Flammeovirga kamogawensis]MBB6463802.1 hypothetical protein [Flammeovirga kamogawensis]QWG06179.1 hypothetical protein KM029_12600 [Flammeovirga kamogawensis]TRX68010.1 hypothetical protein EO216_07620 [Flammeovirga kamogawensis]